MGRAPHTACVCRVRPAMAFPTHLQRLPDEMLNEIAAAVDTQSRCARPPSPSIHLACPRSTPVRAWGSKPLFHAHMYGFRCQGIKLFYVVSPSNDEGFSWGPGCLALDGHYSMTTFTSPAVLHFWILRHATVQCIAIKFWGSPTWVLFRETKRPGSGKVGTS